MFKECVSDNDAQIYD